MFNGLTKEQIGGLIVNAIFGAIGSVLIGVANMRATKKEIQETVVKELSDDQSEASET